jgi:ADP-ribose pyrophosphatase
MGKINHINQKTDNPYVNLYHLEVENKVGHPGNYYVASRAKTAGDLELVRREQRPDGVIIYSLYGEQRDRVVLIRQYRYTIDDYIYELPAGLVEPGEDYHEAAVRELREETGLNLQPLLVDPIYERPYYTTIGMTDECCGTVYGYADGEIRLDLMEENEEIEVVLADRSEVRRILREERVAVVCAYMMMHFLHEEEPFAFLGNQEDK